MGTNARYIVTCLWIVLFLAFLCFFTSIFIYLLFSFILSAVLYPLTRRLETWLAKIHLFGRPLGDKTVRSLSALCSVLLVLVVIVAACVFLFPALVEKANLLTSIDYNSLSVSFDKWLYSAQQFLVDYHFIDDNETIVGILVESLKKFLNVSAITKIFGGAVGFAATFAVSVFAMLFLTFFFVRDRGLFKQGILALVPAERMPRVGRIVDVISKSLAHYFSGVLIEVTCMMVLLTIGMLILGVKNAVLFGVLGGLLNVVPYLGPVIGALICCVLGIINVMSGGDYAAVWPVLLKIVSVFAAANIVDNIVLQPWIYSGQLQVHAVEVFLVILISGMVAGIPGVLLAIPVYMILRTIVLSAVHPERFEEPVEKLPE